MTKIERWKYAIKPNSWPKLLVPFVVGQALAASESTSFLWLAFALGLLFTIFHGLHVVLVNDWADLRVDAIKRDMFPDGCSAKTIPDDVLPANQVFTVGMIAGLFALGTAYLAQSVLDRPTAFLIGAICVGTFAAYSLPPLKLNYRGGGELLEGIGVGILLPAYSAFLHTQCLWSPSIVIFCAGGFFFAMSSALASGLSDEVSDREGGKRTFVTMFGNARVRGWIYLLPLVGAIAWYVAWVATYGFKSGWLVAPIVGFVAWRNLALRSLGRTAVTNAFKMQKRFKRELHRQIWISSLGIGVMFIVRSWWS